MKKTKKSDIFSTFLTLVTHSWFAIFALTSLVLSHNAVAIGLDSTKIEARTFRGTDPSNPKIQCHFELGKAKRSPSNKNYRSVEFGINGNTWNLSDFEPKMVFPLLHYNQQGHYGYEVWAASYTDENHFVRIWMNYMSSKSTPHSVQLYAITKKTGITRLLGDCSGLR